MTADNFHQGGLWIGPGACLVINPVPEEPPEDEEEDHHFNPVPEPSSAILLAAAGVVLLLGRALKRHRRSYKGAGNAPSA